MGGQGEENMEIQTGNKSPLRNMEISKIYRAINPKDSNVSNSQVDIV